MLSARHYVVLAVSALPACGPVGAAAGDAIAWRSQVLQLGEVIAGSQRAVSWDFVNDGGATRITVGEVSCACMNVELRLGSERLKRGVVHTVSRGQRGTIVGNVAFPQGSGKFEGLVRVTVDDANVVLRVWATVRQAFEFEDGDGNELRQLDLGVISEGERKFFELFIRSFDGSVFKLPPQPDVAPPRLEITAVEDVTQSHGKGDCTWRVLGVVDAVSADGVSGGMLRFQPQGLMHACVIETRYIVKPAVQCMPRFVAFGECAEREKRRKDVVLRSSKPGERVRIGRVQVEPNTDQLFECATTTRDDDVVVSVDFSPSGPVGRVSRMLEVHIESPAATLLRIPIVAFVK